MSRHRNFQNMNYDDERDDDDDYECGSVDDEVPMSPSCSEYIFRRPRLNTQNQLVGGTKLSEFIPEEADPADYPNDVIDDEQDMFQMDDVAGTVSLGPPPGLENVTPVRTAPSLGFSVTRIDTSGHQSVIDTANNQKAAVIPNVSNLRVSEAPTNHRSASKSPSRTPAASAAVASLSSNSSSHRLSQLAAISSAPSTPRRSRKTEKKEDKESINLVVVGHVDAGKSTLMGHVLCQLGCVDQRVMHKYRQESNRAGKGSFAYAWVLDETEEERTRGVTMDVARTSFDTPKYRVILLDAPGHRDFIPNMITGASQADAALLVANATRGEFETGFENGGQTREHAMLLRALGVSQLVVAVNKMDTVDWAQRRFTEVESALKAFLAKQAGFSNVRFVPVSGLGGENLVQRVPSGHPLSTWYDGPCLVELIDSFKAPPRLTDGPLRCVINDVLKSTANQLTIAAKVESGEIEKDDKVFIMPNADAAVVRSVANDSGSSSGVDGLCGAGEQALITLSGTFEPDTILPGHVIVRGGNDTLIPGRRFVARIVVFDILVPIMRGTKAELFCHQMCEPCTIVKLVAVVSKTTGEVVKEKPRCLTRQQSGRVEIEMDRDVAIEPFTKSRALGRITLRANGQTIAAGILEEKVI